MSDDWQAGDLALCVNDNDCPVFGPVDLKAGRTYTVAEVRTGACRKTGFRATCLRLIESSASPPWHNQVRFTKARPHTPDAEDTETIRLLTGKPVKEPVRRRIETGEVG